MRHTLCMRRIHRGFTLIELMVVVVVVAILAAIAYPSYTQYLFRSRAVAGTDALALLAVRFEQRFQDVGGYGSGDGGSDDSACGPTWSEPPHFVIGCESFDGGTRFLLTATGSGPVQGLVYTIDDSGVRRTPEHPRGAPADNCWSLRGGTCDS
jgi:type IV pilus assembly protein PilE